MLLCFLLVQQLTPAEVQGIWRSLSVWWPSGYYWLVDCSRPTISATQTFILAIWEPFPKRNIGENQKCKTCVCVLMHVHPSFSHSLVGRFRVLFYWIRSTVVILLIPCMCLTILVVMMSHHKSLNSLSLSSCACLATSSLHCLWAAHPEPCKWECVWLIRGPQCFFRGPSHLMRLHRGPHPASTAACPGPPCSLSLSDLWWMLESKRQLKYQSLLSYHIKQLSDMCWTHTHKQTHTCKYGCTLTHTP